MTDRRQFLAALGSGVAGFSCLTATAQEKGAALPVAKRVVASDDYYGTTVLDPYRWMENANDPELVAWLKAQNARTRALLGKTPGSAAMRKRVSALSGELSVTRDRKSTRLNSSHSQISYAVFCLKKKKKKKYK